MASYIQIFIIAVSLAMDALSVSIAGGLKSQTARTKNALKVAAFFGGFQALMPLIGWLVGELLAGFVSQYAHWIAFLLLTILGIKMIKESFENESGLTNNILDNKTLTLLAIATSIDALIVGITLSLLQTPIIISVTIIGLVTFILCFLGFQFGTLLGEKFGKRVEIFGGIVLIHIGFKILLENFI